MMAQYSHKRAGVNGVIVATCAATVMVSGSSVGEGATRESLSPYMNSIPPSQDYFCVGTGPSNQSLHPDRAPYTQLAQQDGVILFSGAAPQQGLNFALPAGSLIYRNQMNTLGGPEPTPQLGTAGSLQQNSWEFGVPWSQTRWHAGEDITWQGYRSGPNWLGGQPYWNYEVGSSYSAICPAEPLSPEPYKPIITQMVNGTTWNVHSALNLQLARGLYQVAKIRAEMGWTMFPDECPSEFREPWFQGRGQEPAFNVSLSAPPAYNQSTPLGDVRIAEHYFPNYHSIYTFEQLELDGGRLTVDFERSATWPRRTTVNRGLEVSGTGMAENVWDEFGNRVHFDRVPKYSWETDYKVPPRGTAHSSADPNFGTTSLPPAYEPLTNAWRLPHKRLRTVQLFNAHEQAAAEAEGRGAVPDWTLAFVYEHPESDRISATDTPLWRDSLNQEPPLAEWKSLYSYLFQADFEFGRLPELNDETTLLTVQAYKNEDLETFTAGEINGAPFQDDYSVWGNIVWKDNLPAPEPAWFARPNAGIEDSDPTNDDCPGLCGVDDDSDGLIDEDCNDRQPGETGYGQSCPDTHGVIGTADYLEDDNEDGYIESWDGSDWHGVPPLAVHTDPPGAADGDNAPGVKGIDDDGDGLIDEDSNGYQPYLVASLGCQNCQVQVWFGGLSPSCSQTHVNNGCKNPLYWKGTCNGTSWTQSGDGHPFDYFSSWDDDEDGLVDEDGAENPLLVNLRAIDAADACASGKYPFAPPSTNDGSEASLATMPGPDWDSTCRPPLEAAADPWTYQVQYVYARSNPYWLLVGRNPLGQPVLLDEPKYYYHPPFTEPWADLDDDGTRDPNEDLNGDGNLTEYPGNVHPDCLPDPDFLGAQGYKPGSGATRKYFPPSRPSDIQMIKRIVRMRDSVTDPLNYVENVWLYRYDDIGMLKAVFDPVSVQALIDADPDDVIEEPDDILRHPDTFVVAGKYLIQYAAKWLTYYNPRVAPYTPAGSETVEGFGIPACYDEPPFIGDCASGYTLDADSPYLYLPTNSCDGQNLWDDGYSDELHIDPDCSMFMRQDCGWCFARYACGQLSSCDDPRCDCTEGGAVDANMLAQLGIPNAQPRIRNFLVKTARVRGGDGEMHLYRFDYLGAASSVYETEGHITSYADAHNITIVDELVEQTDPEHDPLTASQERSDFYIYEDDFKLNLDPAPERTGEYEGPDYHVATSHYLRVPVKVKTRRVVVMNFYGIAISDRLILTPGFPGDQTSLVDNQQYELVNTRGQLKHLYSPAWVAVLREWGLSAVRNSGQVLTELFGGHEGWYSVLSGIARGSAGGNVYEQQCKTPEVVDEVPTQRVAPDQLDVIRMTQHFDRQPNGPGGDIVRDLPEVEATYYNVLSGGSLPFSDTPCTGAVDCIHDPAGTLGDLSGVGDGTGCAQTECTCGEPGCFGETAPCYRYLADIDLRNQDPVDVRITSNLAGEGDGVSVTRYAYRFREGASQERAVEWKWRWEEAVSTANGGTGEMALEIWHYDYNGRIRLHGRGSGTGTDDGSRGWHPSPAEPFYVAYTGYDALGRPAIHIEDFDLTELQSPPLGLYASDLDSGDILSRLERLPVNPPAQNLITVYRYNDFGVLKSRCVGKPSQSTFSVDPEDWPELTRTDYKLLSNRVITLSNEATHNKPLSVWDDPHIYQIQYEYVTGDLDGAEANHDVHGNTTVTVLDKGGKFIERRVIGWNSARPSGDQSDKIANFGWGLKLADYTYDGAITDHWTTEDIPEDLWADCNDYADCPTEPGDPDYPECLPDPCLDTNDDGVIDLAPGTIYPLFPRDAGGYQAWPPAESDQIITLSLSRKEYNQPSTLEPTDEIVYRSYDEDPDPDTNPDVAESRRVVKSYAYDLEDRVARQKEADGTISRFLFDAKRRATKFFKGSNDEDASWFPRAEEQPGEDDMVLVEHQLYNDGFECREYNPLPGEGAGDPDYDPCSAAASGAVGENLNFPNNTNRLVRVRRFTDAAEPASQPYDAETPSRDAVFIYDWRGRQVITKEVAVGYDNGTVADPIVISATTTVFDNLDRPWIIATWTDGNLPTVGQIEDWAEAMTPGTIDTITEQILDLGPLTLSLTMYDERGRVFEERTYDVGAGADGTYDYLFSRKYRDNLNRVVVELSSTGLVKTEYDSLGRVTKRSTWSYVLDADRQPVEKTELTRMEYTYDAFGRALTQAHFDRRPEHLNPDTFPSFLDDQPGGNALVTYSYNWYDNAKRLIATADFGTNGPDGFTNDQPPPAYSANSPPTWDGYVYKIGGAATSALITRFGYDAASRRIWTQDPMGRVTRNWYDLLGRTLLVAENWKDFSGDSGPAGTNLTPTHQGAIRYTAQHYTRGGLLDMMVAVVPAYGVPPDTFAPDIEPENFDWDEQADQDYAAGSVGFTGLAETPSVQATRFAYHADVVPEISDRVPVRDPTDPPLANFPAYLSRMEYPNWETGQPDPDDALTFTYTIDGKVAQRTDQRGVRLDFAYGVDPACGSCGTNDKLTSVRADIPPDSEVDDTIQEFRFRYDDRGLLLSAGSYNGSGSRLDEVTFTYDSFQNLATEVLNPLNNSTYTKTTRYTWTPIGDSNRSRLERITYPSGYSFKPKYGEAVGDTEDLISRATGLTTSTGMNLIRYETTGAGRTGRKLWGPDDAAGIPEITLDYTSGGTDRFGRVTHMFFDNGAADLPEYHYEYDPNGNRKYARIKQVNHDDDRSYLYQYDELDRLDHAEFGDLNAAGDSFENLGTVVPRATTWQLDVLGNWSGGGSSWVSVREYDDADGSLDYDPGVDPQIGLYHHHVDAANRILFHRITANLFPFWYDQARNLTIDGDYNYVYDAWNRLVEVYERGTLYPYPLDGFVDGVRGALAAQYRYDALGRRINKRVYKPDDLDTHGYGDFFYYDGDRLIEYYTTIRHTHLICTGGGGGDVADSISNDPFPTAKTAESAPTHVHPHEEHEHPESVPTGPSDPKAGVRSAEPTDTVNLPYPGDCYTSTHNHFRFNRRFLYGTNYIDEHIAQYNSSGTRYYVLQDANYNVVAMTNSLGTLNRQYSYEPYGKISAAEYSSGTPINFENDPEALYTWQLHQGLWLDYETGLYYNRARYYAPNLGRFLQRDPNETAHVHTRALSRAGQSLNAKVNLNVKPQYRDGMSLYQYVRGRPTIYTDPSGFEVENCGPDVTDMLAEIIARTKKWRAKQGTIRKHKALAWLKRWGGSMDWTTAQGVKTKNCPKGERCQHTAWLCGECVHDHWIGNFMFAFLARQISISDTVADIGADLAQMTSSGGASDPPWDTAGYEIARNLHDVLRPIPDSPLEGDDLCDILKADAGLWRKANDLRVIKKCGYFPGGVVAEGEPYPKPHVLTEDYKHCKKCPEKLNFQKGAMYGGFSPAFKNFFPDIGE